ncbi:ATP-binding protein [uncultured Pelagimonas sp.]|uniref:ATP-binding protein n=1 Tax=uncultured Pelagimonas sp. TaxID=1618102 RepID=UPI0026265AC1|nr:ATP-binding protein [uncultured Pelagimonas sp.]
MSNRRSRTEVPYIKLLTLTFAAIVAAFLIVFFRIFLEEKESSNRETASVSRVIESRKEQLVLSLERFAASNAAYRNVAREFDPSWVGKRFGQELLRSTGYSASLLLNPEGNVVFSQADHPFFEDNTDALGESIDTEANAKIAHYYLEMLPVAAANGGVFSSLNQLSLSGTVDFGSHVAFTSTHAIVPDPGGIDLAEGKPYILTTVYLLDDAHLLEILSKLSLSDLTVRKEIPSGMNGVAIETRSGRIAAYLVWTPMSQGIAILTASSPFLISAVFVIFAMSLLLVQRNSLAGKQLIKQEAQLKSALQIARMGGFALLPDDRFIWQDEIVGIFGWTEVSPADKLSDFVAKHVRAADRVAFEEYIVRVRSEGNPVSILFGAEHADGTQMWLRMQAQLQGNEKTKDAEIVGILQDVTEFKTMADRLRQSQKMEAIGNLTGGIAHDFNNLLAIISGNLELIEGETTKESKERRVAAALAAVQRASDLTRDMLSFARLAPLSPEPLNLNKVVENTRNWGGRVLPASINLKAVLADDLWSVDVDSRTVENTLLNLLVNARDAMPNGGQLTIETANVQADAAYLNLHMEELEPGNYVMLAVTDTGMGISKEQQSLVFDPFFTTKGPSEGTGLGLAAVQGFIKQSGGMVHLYSEIGEGTTFKLYFPQGTTEAKATPSPQKPATRKNVQSSTVLLAEDEPELRELLTSVLSSAGYIVHPADSGDAALRIYEEIGQIDILLTDIVMPGDVMGPQLARQLREKQPSLRAVFMSGYPNEAKIHGNGLRPEDVRLTKPVAKAKLLEALETASAGAANDQPYFSGPA